MVHIWRVVGTCAAGVEGLGALRNKLSDSQGKGPKGAKPETTHAELAVNLAGSMATFLIETWERIKAEST
jgi:abortive infection Abi-like protein